MQLSCPSDKFESGGGRLKRLVYKHALCTFSTSRPLLRPPNFCFGSGILWCRASGTRTIEHFSNICAQTQAKLTLLGARRSQSFDRMPVPSTGFRAGCTERLLCLAPARLWWVRKQTGWTEGQTATWERTEFPPPSETDTGTGRLLSWVVDRQRSKSSGRQVWLVAEELGCFQGNRGVVQPLFSKEKRKEILLNYILIHRVPIIRWPVSMKTWIRTHQGAFYFTLQSILCSMRANVVPNLQCSCFF